MAILRVQSQAQRESEQPDTPATSLRHGGPIVEVTISTAQSALPALVQQGRPVRPAFTGLALISTQAKVSMIDFHAARILELPILDVAEGDGDSTGVDVYAVHFSIVGMSFARDVERVLGLGLSDSLLMVIGRDVLQDCAFLYDGKHGEFTLFS